MISCRLVLADPSNEQKIFTPARIWAAFVFLPGSRFGCSLSLPEHGTATTPPQSSGRIRLVKVGRASGPTEQQVRIEHLPLAPALCRATSWASASVGMRIEQLLPRPAPSLALPDFPQPHQPILEVTEFSCTALRLEALPTDTRVSTARICRSRSCSLRTCPTSRSPLVCSSALPSSPPPPELRPTTTSMPIQLTRLPCNALARLCFVV